MADKPPDAFLSYTRFDDRHDGGAIGELRRRLASAVRAVSGLSFEIFQDVDGIGLGEHWPGKLDRLLDEVRFFIPIRSRRPADCGRRGAPPGREPQCRSRVGRELLHLGDAP